MTIASIVHKDGYLEITDSDGNFWRVEVKWADTVVSAIESSGQYRVVNIRYRIVDGHLIVVYTDGTTQSELDIDPSGGGVSAHGDLTGVTADQHHNETHTPHDAVDVEVEELSAATYDDLQDYMNFFGDSTLLTGGAITTNGDGSCTVASGTAWTKATDSKTAIGLFFNFPANNSVSLTDMKVSFIYIDYNGGTPQVVVANDAITHGFKRDHVIIGALFRDGTTLHIKQTVNIGIGRINNVHMHHIEESVAHRASGVLTSATGTRQLIVTSGVLYAGLSRQTTNAFNTSTGGTFSYWYTPDSGSSWTEVTGQTAIDNTQYNDITSGLSGLTGAAKRGVHWVYIDLDGNDLHVVYGQDNYTTANAELAAVPAVLPPLVVNYCLLIAKIIVQKDQDTLFIAYPWTSAFLTSLATDHGSLAGLADDDHSQYLLADGSRELTGDIAVTASKTVDGRDLSVDGGKLDGVAAGAIANVVEDTTPQLGGDLDLNDKNILLKIPPGSDDIPSGMIWKDATVDTNAEGIGAPLFMAADGHFDTADADASTTSPCVALALETGTGTKDVLLFGVMRNDGWNWTIGPGKAGLIYCDVTVGTLTQTQPTGTDDVVQPVGWAISADVMFFCPSMMYFTHT